VHCCAYHRCTEYIRVWVDILSLRVQLAWCDLRIAIIDLQLRRPW
jgi:hypothetical protein